MRSCTTHKVVCMILPTNLPNEIRVFLKNCKSETQVIRKLKQKDEYLINFLKAACNQDNCWDKKKPNLINRLVNTIEDISLKGKLSLDNALKVEQIGLNILKKEHMVTISSPSGQTVQLSRIKFAALSSVFGNLLKEKKSTIVLDVEEIIDEVFFFYLENGNLPDITHLKDEHLSALSNVASKYKLDELVDIIKCIYVLYPQDERTEKNIIGFMSYLKDIVDAKLVDIIKYIDVLLPQNQKTEKNISYFKRFHKGIPNLNLIRNIIFHINMLPKLDRISSLQILKKNIGQLMLDQDYRSSAYSPLQFLLSTQPSLKTKTFAYWIKTLNDPCEKKVVYFSEFILDCFDLLGLSETHSLVQEALRVRILQLPENLCDLGNPYYLFKTLKAKRAEKVMVNEEILPKETLEGYEIHLNVQFFKELQKKVPTFKDLPNVSSLNLKKIVNALSDRIENASFNVEIMSMTEINYNSLLSESLGGDEGTVYLYNLLDVAEEKEMPFPIIPAKLKCIVSYIESLLTRRTRKQIFSEQEITLIKMLGSIQYCTTGKDEGIMAFYTNVVPMQFKLDLDLENEKNNVPVCQTKGRHLLYTMILDEVENMFSGQNNFFKFLMDLDPYFQQEEIDNAAHQSKYVRNLIGHEVGLPNTLYFDRYSHVVSEFVVEQTKQEVLELFYIHFLPHRLVNDVQIKINQALAGPKNPYYLQLNSLLKADDMSSSWAFNTKKGKITITQKATIQLLEVIGAIKVVSSPKNQRKSEKRKREVESTQRKIRKR